MLLITSFVIIAWGQPDSGLFLCLLASSCGFAFFWVPLLHFKKKDRFWIGTGWFTSVQLAQLSWLADTNYQGLYILFVYFALSLLIGMQFGLLCSLFPKRLSLKLHPLLGLAGGWTLLEWVRLYVMCGFAWNPIGLAMTALPTTSQIASIGGVYALSFWTAWVNLLLLSALVNRSLRRGLTTAFALLIPFLFGLIHIKYHDIRPKEGVFRAALIQTALLPHEKSYFRDKPSEYVSPYDQWISIIDYLDREKVSHVELIALPESALPFSARDPIYPYREVEKILKEAWGSSDWSYLLLPPFAEKGDKWYVNNLFWARAFADHYNAEVVIGLEDQESGKGKSYNAAFHLLPQSKRIDRYEKRILLPLAEYLPFPFLKPLVSRYGILDFFTHGTQAKVFKGRMPLSVSICYEECFGHLIREGRLKGAKLFVNLTNDAWYPHSRLHLKHYLHGRVRAIENGTPLLRACNTGVTVAVDSVGRTVDQFGNWQNLNLKKGALIVEIDRYTYSTPYTYFGDTLIVGISLLCVLSSLILALRDARADNIVHVQKTSELFPL